MRLVKYFLLAFLITLPINQIANAQPALTQSELEFLSKDFSDDEVFLKSNVPLYSCHYLSCQYVTYQKYQ